MINVSDAFKTAITATRRKSLVQVIADLTSPDLVIGAASYAGISGYADASQLTDGVTTLGTPFAEGELNRWMLDGSFDLAGEIPAGSQVAYESAALFKDDGSSPDVRQYVELAISGVTTLQAVTVYFPTAAYDGYPTDMTLEIYSGGSVAETVTVSGNTADHLVISGFTVSSPGAVRLYADAWSLPKRRMRVVELIPGYFDVWTKDDLATLEVIQQGNFSATALPYGVCSLAIDNSDRLFEPRNKNSIFNSLEERQSLTVKIGVETENGPEFVPVGKFFLALGGWKTSNNALTMSWSLVDIIGLLADRKFTPPSPLPTTLSGWISAVVAHLGTNFAGFYHVDPNYSSASVTALTSAAVEGMTCGQVIMCACQKTGTWARADAETGYLTIEPLWSQGNTIDLDDVIDYPTMSANEDVSGITISTGGGDTFSYSGTNDSSPNSISVNNPFLLTETEAQTVARQILEQYGGNRIETTGRGNPASEIGDVTTVQLDESTATTGRLMYQSFAFSEGVLQGCKSVMLQADGAFSFSSRAVIDATGTWTVPADVDQVRVILVGKGQDGTAGGDGSFSAPGPSGNPGNGGKVWTGTINVTGGQTITVNIGDNTEFGAYSSANGSVYPTGYTDILSGSSYARPGVRLPKAGSGDGGMGGDGGSQGYFVRPYGSKQQTVVWPGTGSPGVAGATGCAIIYWEEATA